MRHATMTKAAVLCAGVLIAAGCSSGKPSKADLTSAIDNYYSANPDCIFSNPVQLPAKVDNSNAQQLNQYNALAGAGLLNKAEAKKPEPKQHTRRSRRQAEQKPAEPQTTTFDLSDNGRFSWTADQTMPGYGNFCFGHRHVTSIDSSAASKKNGQMTAVASYHYDYTDVPSWAKNDQVQAAFPNVQKALAGPQVGKASLNKEPTGWTMAPPAQENGQQNGMAPATPGTGETGPANNPTGSNPGNSNGSNPE